LNAHATDLRCVAVADTRHPFFTRSTRPACPVCDFTLTGLAPRGNCPECGADYEPSRIYPVVAPKFWPTFWVTIAPLVLGLAVGIPLLVWKAVSEDIDPLALITLKHWSFGHSLIGLGLAVSAASATLYFGALIATEPGRGPPPLKTRVFGFIAILVFAQVAALAMTVSLLPIISWIVGEKRPSN